MKFEDFLTRIKERMTKVSDIEAKNFASILIKAGIESSEIPVLKFFKAAHDEYQMIKHDEKSDEILKILDKINSRVIETQIRIKVNRKYWQRFVENFIIADLREIRQITKEIKKDTERIPQIASDVCEMRNIFSNFLNDYARRERKRDILLQEPGEKIPKEIMQFLIRIDKSLKSAASLMAEKRLEEATEILKKAKEKLESKRFEITREKYYKQLKKDFSKMLLRAEMLSGSVELNKENYDDAIKIFESCHQQSMILEDYEIVSEALYEIGSSYGVAKRYIKANEILKRAFSFAEEYNIEILPRICFNIGLSSLFLWKHKDCVTNIIMAIENAEKISDIEVLRDAHNLYGFLLESMEGKEKAEKHYKKALEIDSRHAPSHNNYANFLLKEMRLKEAEKHYKRALEIDPDNIDMHHNYACMLERYSLGERWEEAENHFRKALKINSNDDDIQNDYAILLYRMKRFKEAEKHYKKAIRVNPNEMIYYYNYSNLLKEMGKVEESDRYYRKALKLIEEEEEFWKKHFGNT